MAEHGQTRTARRKQKKQQKKKKPLWRRIVKITLLAILAIGIGIGILFTYYIVTAPKLDESELVDPFSSEIFDMDGDLYADLGAEQRTKIEYDDLPQVLIDAVVATEDSRFFKHHGIDLYRIGGAIKANVLHGFGSQGASTLTQQVVENSFFNKEKKLKRKVQEQWLSLKLEREYSKEEIMEMYLNKIFYGNQSYGVAKAAENYFDKDLEDLTLPEAAILAGLPQRPTGYNPFVNPDLTEKRMNTVLKLMVRHDKITQEEADEARDVDIESLLVEKEEEPTPYQAFLDEVEKEVKDKLDGADIYSDGLKVYTTIDTDVQDHVEYLLSDSDDNPIAYPDNKEDANGDEKKLQVGAAVLDTTSGAVRAIGGSRDSSGNRGYNYAVQGAGRQPGSSIKPIVDYGPAIEYENWSTYHQLNDDKPYKIEGTDAEINNFDNQFHGWMSLRTALSKSYNIPAVKTFDEVGLDNAKEFASGLGIDLETDGITEAIGGTETRVTPLKMAGAFRAFGNEGIYNEPFAVEKVEFPDGKVVELKPESEAVMADSTAYMITDVLKTALTEGTGQRANIPGLPMAAKTGTTNLKDEEGSPDSWLTGYTTNYTMSIWTGYDGPSLTMVGDEKKVPHDFLKNTMQKISEDVDTPDFEKPDSVVEVGVERGSNPAKLPSGYTPESNIIKELFVKGHEPESVSEEYDEIDPVSDLSAKYDDDEEEIQVEWDYDSDDDVTFEISASEDGGEMNSLSSTDDTSFEISSVEPGTEYEIEVVAISKDDDSDKSEAKSTTVKVPGDEDDDDNNENDDEESMSPVDDLDATFKEDENIIDVNWDYEGPPASFEVDVNGQKQTVDYNGIEISGANPGESYTIIVTAIGKEGANEDVRSEEKQTEITIPDDEGDDDNNDNNNGNNNGDNNDNNNNNGNDNGNEDDNNAPPNENNEDG